MTPTTSYSSISSMGAFRQVEMDEVDVLYA